MSDNVPNILLIEDNEIDRELVSRLIGSNFTLIDAATGADGLRKVNGERPDLVLLDYHLPDVNSFDLLEKFIAVGLPVVLLTGEDNPEVIVAAMLRGARNYVLKERLTRESLLEVIQSALENRPHQVTRFVAHEKVSERTIEISPPNDDMRHMAAVLVLVEQRERKRIAQLLHDHVQQLLYGAQMRLHLVREDLPAEAPAQLNENASAATRFVEEAIAAARTLAADLSPPVLSDDGLSAAFRSVARRIEELHGLHVDVRVQQDFTLGAVELQTLVVQTVQELLFNVVKHANVDEALVWVYAHDGAIQVAVEDKGIGFEAGKLTEPVWEPQMGYGLYTIRQRLALFGCRLDVQAHPHNGARITIVLPYDSVSIINIPRE